MRLAWRPLALADVQVIRVRIERDQRAAAERVAERIMAATELLLVYPELGRLGRATGTRELVVARTPYLVIYRHRAETVTIVRVLHGAQEWP